MSYFRVSADSVRLGLGWRASERVTLGGEVEREVDGDQRRRIAIGADWRLTDWARLYTRWERQSGWTSLQGVSARDGQATALVVGIDGQPLNSGNEFGCSALRRPAAWVVAVISVRRQRCQSR